jgi:hypothetical protein
MVPDAIVESPEKFTNTGIPPPPIQAVTPIQQLPAIPDGDNA